MQKSTIRLRAVEDAEEFQKPYWSLPDKTKQKTCETLTGAVSLYRRRTRSSAEPGEKQKSHITCADTDILGQIKTACNALLLKVNQIGTLTEAISTVRAALDAG